MLRKYLVGLLSLALLLAGCTPKATLDTSVPYVAVSFTYEPGLRYAPSYAIWAQDDEGHRATLFVTGKAAGKNFRNARPAALPVWFGFQNTNTDAVSGATPSGKLDLKRNLPEELRGKKLTLTIEANASYDYNDYYKEGLKAGQEGYNDVNGQPSVLWSVSLDPASDAAVGAQLVGAGDVLGADSAMHQDLSHVTTAKDLLQNITVQLVNP